MRIAKPSLPDLEDRVAARAHEALLAQLREGQVGREAFGMGVVLTEDDLVSLEGLIVLDDRQFGAADLLQEVLQLVGGVLL